MKTTTRIICFCIVELLMTSHAFPLDPSDPVGPPSAKPKGIGDFHEVNAWLRKAVQESLDGLAGRVMASPNGAIGDPYPTAVTALAGLAFLAHGDTPNRGRYARPLRRVLNYIMALAHRRLPDEVAPNGNVQGLIDTESEKEKGRIMYSHGYATLFLAETYGTTRNPELRRVLREAIGLIERTQGPGGGWSYKPISQKRNDMSVGVCQTMALRAARNTGISVSRQVIDRAILCAVRARTKEVIKRSPDFNLGFTYESLGPGKSSLSFPVTCGALCILYGLGVYEDNGKPDPEKNPGMLIKPALRYVMQEVKAASHHGQIAGRSGEEGGAFRFYGVYYTVQALAQAGGEEYWGKGFPMIRDAVLKIRNGKQGRRWRQYGWEVNRDFEAAITCIVLQVPYQYLPIFER